MKTVLKELADMGLTYDNFDFVMEELKERRRLNAKEKKAIEAKHEDSECQDR
jgi:hypothetical protein